MPNSDPISVSRNAHHSMGTTFEVLIAGFDKNYAAETSRAVFDEVDRIERLLSRFDPGSDISRANRLLPGGSLRIGVEVYDCLQTALETQEETSGAFDVSFRSRTKGRFGENKTQRQNAHKTAAPPFSLSKEEGEFLITVHPRTETPFYDGPEIDLGGIGKGYALDRAAEVLSDWGIDHALIHGGTSSALAVGSAPDMSGRGWPVGLGRSRHCPGAPSRYFLKGKAISGSGPEVKSRHIYDPRSGKAARGHLSAWLSHPSAAAADALSTAFLVMTPDEVSEYCARHPEIWALVITAPKICRIFRDGRVII